MRRKLLILLTGVLAVVLAVVIWQLLFPASTTISEQADYGQSPQLVEPHKTLVPVLRPAKAVGWPDNQAPSPASGLEINAFVSGLDHPRWLYVMPNGDVLVAESNAPDGSGLCSGFKNFAAGVVLNYSGARTPSADRISLHRDTNGDGVADESHVFADGLYSPFGIALVEGHLYIANADALIRFPYRTGQIKLTESPEVIAELPSGMNHHWTKNIIQSADGQALFITVGSNSNVGECGPEAEEGRAAIHRFDLESGELELFAHGLRNPVGMAIEPSTEQLWTVVNERDELGSDLVPDYATSVNKGDFFGWPYLYFGDKPQPDLDPRWSNSHPAARAPDYALGAHTASLDLEFSYESTLPEKWRGGLFVSQHGSWNRQPVSGYRVIYIPFIDGMPNGEPVELVSGFLDSEGNARGRPAGMALDGTGALLIADDVGNVIWRVK